MTKNNKFTSNILNEVRGYYTNAKNYLNEEAYAIKADNNIMSRIMDMVEIGVFETNSDGSYIIPISNDNNYDMSVIISNNGEAIITDRDGNENELVLTPEQSEQIISTIHGCDMVAESSKGNSVYRQTIGNTVVLNEEQWDPSQIKNHPIIAVVKDEDLLNESIFETESPSNGNNLLQMAIEAYKSNDKKVSVGYCDDDFLELEITTGTAHLLLTVNYDYQVLNYSSTPDTYDSPGYLDFDSEVTATGLEIYDYNTEDDQDFNEPEAMQLADDIAHDYIDKIDEYYMDNNTTEDYADSRFDF